MVTDDMPRHWYEDYERGRPGYPDQVVDLAELAPSATVLELAAGTGKFTRQLVSRIAHVVAVEPDTGMRRLLVAGCPGVEAIDGTAEQIRSRTTRSTRSSWPRPSTGSTTKPR